MIAVEIEYQQTVRYDDGQFRVRFPMVVGPRYVPGEVSDASRITPPVAHPSRGPLNPVSLRAELDPGVALARLEATHHRVDTVPLADGRWEITLADGPVPADRDFELVWEPVAGAAPAAALFAEDKDGEVYALLMVMPPALPALNAARTSNHRAMPEPRRSRFFEAIAEVVRRMGDEVVRDYETVALLARKR